LATRQYKYVAPNGAVGGFQAAPAIVLGRFFHDGQGRSFFGKIQPVEIFGCKTKGINCENATVSQLI
jgi:hypothetical protein